MIDETIAPRGGTLSRNANWRGEPERDLVTYRLLDLGKALVQHTGQQEDIAAQVDRHSDLLVQLANEGFLNLVPQAIITTANREQLYYGRVRDRRDEYLMYCRAAAFEAAVQYEMADADHDVASGRVHFFRGDAQRADLWARELTRSVERGVYRRGSDAQEPEVTADPDTLAARHGLPGATPKNRHRFKRSSVFCAGKIIVSDLILDCDVLNISAGGAQIRIIGDKDPPDAFRLRIEGFDEFDCDVVRRAGRKIGLTFNAPPEEVEKLVDDIIDHPEKTNEVRKFPRRLVLLSGAIYVENRAVDCRILDISVGGARLRTERAFEHDSRFPLMIYRFGEFPVQVAWEDDTELGITFTDEPDEIQRVIGHILPQKTEGMRRH